ncbi:exported hypothetical protein [Streptomyces misionensis JCM 4497]
MRHRRWPVAVAGFACACTATSTVPSRAPAITGKGTWSGSGPLPGRLLCVRRSAKRTGWHGPSAPRRWPSPWRTTPPHTPTPAAMWPADGCNQITGHARGLGAKGAWWRGGPRTTFRRAFGVGPQAPHSIRAVRAAVKAVAPGCARGVVVLQSVKVRVTVALGSRGFGAGKRVNGRKRHLLTGTLGLLLAVLVIAASVTGRGGASDPSSPGCAGHSGVCGRPGWCLGPVLHAWGLWRVRVSGRPFLSLVCPGIRPGSAF